jgi:hypothetical protein
MKPAWEVLLNLQTALPTASSTLRARLKVDERKDAYCRCLGIGMNLKSDLFNDPSVSREPVECVVYSILVRLDAFSGTLCFPKLFLSG